MRTIAKGLTLGLIWLVAGCALEPPFAQQVANRPLPRTEQQRSQECRWLESERSKQQSLAASGPAMATSPEASILYGPVGRRNLAAIDARVALVGCGEAADAGAPAGDGGRVPAGSAAPPAASGKTVVDRPPPAEDRRPPPADLRTTGGTSASVPPQAGTRRVPDDAEFDACFRRCRGYTDRSKEQCFDACYR